jgi:hypothetical protein
VLREEEGGNHVRLLSSSQATSELQLQAVRVAQAQSAGPVPMAYLWAMEGAVFYHMPHGPGPQICQLPGQYCQQPPRPAPGARHDGINDGHSPPRLPLTYYRPGPFLLLLEIVI